MENNKSEFKCMGIIFNAGEILEMQISKTGDLARYRQTIPQVMGDDIITNGRWQEIRYSKNGLAYITSYGRKIYLHKFQRIY